MRIAIIGVKSLEKVGGIECYVLELAQGLGVNGIEVDVFSTQPTDSVERKAIGVKYHTVPGIPLGSLEKVTGSFSAICRIIIRNRKYDVIHLNSCTAGFLWWLIPRWITKHIVVQMHGIEWQRERWGSGVSHLLKAMEWLTVKNAKNLTVVSNTQVKYFNEIYGLSSRFIPTAARLLPVGSARFGLTSEKYILFVSRLVPEKGLHLLLEAWSKLNSSGFQLAIAGGGSEGDSYVKTLKRQSETDESVIWLGHLGPQDLAKLYSDCFVYVHPSSLEGLSISLLQAMGYGCCCLVSDIPENLEALGGAGITFQNGSATDLEQKLSNLLAYPRHWSKDLRDQAKTRVAEHFSWERVISDFIQYYQSLEFYR